MMEAIKAKITNFFIANTNIIFSIIIVFFARMIFALLPSFGIDMGTWLSWAGRLASLGFAKFYSASIWTQYTPGFMYWLWVIGKTGWVTDLAVKLPVILADIATATLIWSLVGKINKKLAVISFFLYVLNPVTIFDGSVWGQIDGILTLFLFLSAYFLIERKNLIWSVFFWAVAFLIKPQALAVAPVFLLAIIVERFPIRKIVLGVVTGALTIFLLSLPFFPGNSLLGFPRLVVQMGQFYSYTSVNAFNIWSWVGFWKPDSTVIYGLSLSVWGTVLLAISVFLALFVFARKIKNKADYYLLFAVLSLAFFVFPTRVHERYLFPFFAFLLTSAGLSQSLNLYGVYIVTSIASFLNLYYPYSYYYPNQLRSDLLFNLSSALAKIIGFVFLATYFVLLWWEKLPKLNLPKFSAAKSTPVKLPAFSLPERRAKIFLYVILTFAFVTRVFDLASPPTMYFDEVYHAFTAKVILSNDVAKAWEWWNTPPAGFAYEWTHPPLAKLGMALGMIIFGQNSFGWRIPGALLGVGSVFLVYLIAKKLFKDEAVGLLSAAAFSLDGLALVMSRIAMNDSYILFFALLSIYLFMRNNNFWSAVALGLSLASKWSAVWAIPILGILWLWRKKKFSPSILWFFVIPPAIYLLSYFDMFLTGHNLTIWWGMQEQMWWYHTGLRATHPYSSPWWEWPFLIRPIYLYTSDEINGWVSRIYAFGNPLVFWFGFTSVIISAVYAFIEKNKRLGLVVFSYLVFFVPWALSPRIMFLYHYLPSIPFMCIAIGFVLRRNPKMILYFVVPALVLFIYFYPHWAGLSVPLWLDKSYYWVSSWR